MKFRFVTVLLGMVFLSGCWTSDVKLMPDSAKSSFPAQFVGDEAKFFDQAGYEVVLIRKSEKEYLMIRYGDYGPVESDVSFHRYAKGRYLAERQSSDETDVKWGDLRIAEDGSVTEYKPACLSEYAQLKGVTRSQGNSEVTCIFSNFDSILAALKTARKYPYGFGPVRNTYRPQ